MSLTAQLYDLIAAKPVNDADLEAAALFTLDAAANAAAGRNTAQGRILCDWGRARGACGGGNATDAGRRALVLGALTHILEMDDLHRASVVHPGCAVVSAAWAVGEKSGGAHGGRDLLTAVLWGFEAATRIGMAVGPAHYRIFHNTATCGPFGAAMAAAHLLGLDRGQAVHALGNAGAQAAGFWEFLETGAMSKHLHAGRAAEAGLVAAELAALGFTGAPEILEGPRGFFAGLCPDGAPEKVCADPDAPWQLHATSIKPWPSCRHTHPAIDAAIELRRKLPEGGNDVSAIAEVAVDAYQAALDLCDRPDPDTVYGAKFSLQHCVAAALARDAVDLDAFEHAARSGCAGLRSVIRVSADPGFEAAYPAHWGSRVTVVLTGGQTIVAERTDAKGDPELLLGADEMTDKARGLLRHGGYEDAEALISGVLDMAGGGQLPRLAI